LAVPIPDDELIFVGDRIFTDVVAANRMKQRRLLASIMSEKSDRSTGPLAIWTTGVWQKEGMMLRWMEKTLMEVVQGWTSAPQDDVDRKTEALLRTFVRTDVAVEAPVKKSLVSRVWSRFQKR
jgi:hypothetical protein